MNVALLIDAVVRQTTVLVAQLATSGGLRAPLAHVANQVFTDLAAELEAQGLSRKVSADMFGMALRTYQRRMQRLQEGTTERGRSLWEAVYDFIRSRDVVDRRVVLETFAREEEAVVRGILHDLVESGLVFATGTSQETSFRAATPVELGRMAEGRSRDLDELVWAIVFRTGPVKLSVLGALGGLDQTALTTSITRLLGSGRIRKDEESSDPTFSAAGFFVPLGTSSGWEAAVFDHYHALVRTVCAKLRESGRSSSSDDTVGGSTYSFEVWEGHPLEAKVLSSLERFRAEHSELRKSVRAYNENTPVPERRTRVVVYGGQCAWQEGGDEDI